MREKDPCFFKALQEKAGSFHNALNDV